MPCYARVRGGHCGADPSMACKGSGVQIPLAPPGTTHLLLTLAASFASNLPANDAGWPLQRGASPGLSVEGGLRRGQDDDQALLDRGDHAGGHVRGGVPVVGADGAGLKLPKSTSCGFELTSGPMKGRVVGP